MASHTALLQKILARDGNIAHGHDLLLLLGAYFAIIATANHYILDAAIGAVLIVVAFGVYEGFSAAGASFKWPP